MKKVRMAIACALCALLGGCHDYHGFVDWSSGIIVIDFDGIGPDFNCEKPGHSRWMPEADRKAMCNVVSRHQGSCGTDTTASFGVSRDPNAEGGYTYDFTCGQTRHHP